MFMNKFTLEMRGNLTYILTWKQEDKGKGGGEKDEEIRSFHTSKTKLGIEKKKIQEMAPAEQVTAVC